MFASRALTRRPLPCSFSGALQSTTTQWHQVTTQVTLPEGTGRTGRLYVRRSHLADTADDADNVGWADNLWVVPRGDCPLPPGWGAGNGLQRVGHWQAVGD